MGDEPSQHPDVAEQIKRLRKAARLTQAQLAQRANISLDAVTRLETAQRSPNLTTIYALAKALGVAPAQMLGAPRPDDQPPAAIARISQLLSVQPPEVVNAVEVCVREIVDAIEVARRVKA